MSVTQASLHSTVIGPVGYSLRMASRGGSHLLSKSITDAAAAPHGGKRMNASGIICMTIAVWLTMLGLERSARCLGAEPPSDQPSSNPATGPSAQPTDVLTTAAAV